MHPHKVGAAHLQTQEHGERKPLGIRARTLSSTEQNYSATEKECLAILFGIQACRPHLQGERFTVYKDHNALR